MRWAAGWMSRRRWRRSAEMLGVGDRIGSLQEGKDADIIILDGHPLHYSTFVELTLVNGKVLYDKSKSTYFSHIRAEREAIDTPGEGD
ncbi:MAG: amidohydrolase family protein [Armatimonadota bacterium]